MSPLASATIVRVSFDHDLESRGRSISRTVTSWYFVKRLSASAVKMTTTTVKTIDNDAEFIKQIKANKFVLAIFMEEDTELEVLV